MKIICEHLVKIGHQVEVVAPYDVDVVPDDSQVVKVHRFRYIWPENVHIMGHSRSLEKDVRLKPLVYFLLPLYLLAAFVTLLRVSRRQRAQIIYAHWVLPSGLVGAWVAGLNRVPLAISLHGSDVFIAQKSAIFRRVARWIFKRTAAVTANSAELRENALDLGAPGDLLLKPYGTDPQEFSPKYRSREETGSAEQAIIIAGLGRFVYKKGFDHLLEAMKEVIQSYPNARLVLGGAGELLDEYQRQAEQLEITEYVSFPGSILRSNTPAFFADADIFVLPSVRDQYGNVDGLPSVLLEAMSSARPVVASEIGGVNLVVRDGQNGLLVPPGDVEALANAIIRLIDDDQLRRRLGDAGRESVVQDFSCEAFARSLTSLIESIM
jgi:glycosyltransferase involved in cell wall biosynthesis